MFMLFILDLKEQNHVYVVYFRSERTKLMFMLFILDLKEPNHVYVVYFRSERTKSCLYCLF
jgi:hypothetical protein